MWDQTYANMLSIMDTVVANVTSALIDTGQWNRTLLIFTADNGGISTVGWVRCGVSHHPPRCPMARDEGVGVFCLFLCSAACARGQQL
jgi:arylsulfatase A-like enzyme